MLKTLLTQLADETTPGCVDTVFFGQVCDNCNGSAPMQILASVVKIMTFGVGILAVIGILVFGIKYLTSGGNENLAIKARRHLFQVLLGVVSYVILVLIASWIMPGNLTTTMLGGTQGTCPGQTKTDITVVDQDSDKKDGDDGGGGGGDTQSDTPSDGWKIGERPRECGPGEPGDFQTLKPNGYKRFYLYTNSAGRTFAQYKQDDSQWGGLPLRKGGSSTMSRAGCCHTSYAMIAESFSSGQDYFPKTDGDHDMSGNTEKRGSTSCKGADCDSKFAMIKDAIDNSGVVLIHACGQWGETYKDVCGKIPKSTHWFLLVDYRITNGRIEYFFLNTGDNVSSFYGKNGTGWGVFGGGKVETYSLYFRYPKASKFESLDCKVRSY